MKGTVSELLAVARRNIGIEEKPRGSNKQPYAAIAGHANGAAWCQTFAVAVAKTAGVGLFGGEATAYTPSAANAYKAAGRYGKEARVGAQVFFYYESMGRIAHTGWVESVEPGGKFFISIEGNTDEAGGRTGGKVMRKRRSTRGCTFGYPTYKPEPAPKKTVRPKPARVRPTLREGNRGQDVTDLQVLLTRHGARGLARDGDFGPGTKKAVMAFQKKRGLVADGVVGKATWAELE